MAPTSENHGQVDYVGQELELFQRAENWKRYLATRLRPYLAGDLLEVGAGLGANIAFFYRPDLTRWLSLEPDSRLCHDYRRRQRQDLIPASCELVQGTLDTLPESETFDSITYIDVLEHIHDDRSEFNRAFARLRPKGHLVILCPAHKFLFSPFDKAIGHCRRYNKRMYRELSDRPPLTLEYLDSVGMIASVANRLLLRQSYPAKRQIQLWDRVIVRLSSWLDPLTFRKLGKSILGVWEKP